jgi:hypothetical protein
MFASHAEFVIHEVVSHVRRNTVETTAAPSVISYNSNIEMSLQNRKNTAWVHEAEFRFIGPENEHHLLATTCLLNCVALFVYSPKGHGFCAHISPIALQCGLQEAVVMRKDGVVFGNMLVRMKEVFSDTKNSDLRISLVGGWRLADLHPTLREKYYPTEKSLWKFSAVVRKFAIDAFPGASLDTSELNRFDGVSWEDRTAYAKMKRVAVGEAFRIAVLDTSDGKISVQTTDLCDLTDNRSAGASIPSRIVLECEQHLLDMQQRAYKFKGTWSDGDPVPAPVLQEYEHRLRGGGGGGGRGGGGGGGGGVHCV